jgi:NADPH:quinone reductase-like Zn-dependent oxidoreductase
VRAAIFERFGEPAEVLEVRDLPRPEPGPGQVRVRMIASPINPSELMTVRGKYGSLPRLPASPGFEGVGVVDAARGLLGRLLVGRRVAVLNRRGGNWREWTVLPTRDVIPMPSGLPDDQAATSFVNPVTAVAMVRRVLRVPRGAWLLQTAAGSALGRMVIALGRRDGFRTLNVVRRSEQVEELRQLGADAVIAADADSLEEQAAGIAGRYGVRYAIDAVGGPTAASVARALAPGGRMLLYGSLSGEPIPLEPRSLLFGSKRLEGFWLADWVAAQSRLSLLPVILSVRHLLAGGVLRSPIAATYPLAEVKAAVAHAEQAGRGGKVLLRMGEGVK